MDAATVLMIAGGCALLVTGGAVLRGSDQPVRDLVTRLRARLAERNQDVAALETRLREAEDAAANRLDAMEDLRVEMERNLTAKHERQSGLQTEVDRLTRDVERLEKELTAERKLAQQMESAADDLRKMLKTAQDDAKKPRAPSAPPPDAKLRRELDDKQKEVARLQKELADEKARASAESGQITRALEHAEGANAALTRELDERRREADKAKTIAPQAVDASSELRTEITSLQRSLEHVTKERDAARQAAETLGVERDAARERIEAMERLVEGVRARSRELTDELQRLRGRG